MHTLLKYPRTQHIQSSRLQHGDETLAEVPFGSLRGCHLVIEEKMDGANSGLSFDAQGQIHLQSRGHFLTGGPRERHFQLLKTWANTIAGPLFDVLQDRYVMYGEWLYAKHTVFYDALPHYFMEFDLYDRQTQTFLSTDRRHEMLRGLPIVSVKVLSTGSFRHLKSITRQVQASEFKTAQWRQNLERVATERNLDPARALRETDAHDEMEGLYLKWEEDGEVKGRYKYVRDTFQASLQNSGSHWQSRPIIPNQLAQGVSLFNIQPGETS